MYNIKLFYFLYLLYFYPLFFFFLMNRRPPISPLFPSPPLSRSGGAVWGGPPPPPPLQTARPASGRATHRRSQAALVPKPAGTVPRFGTRSGSGRRPLYHG